MIERQGGVCAACRIDKPIHVDHDHVTGKVRGVLCFLCNQALGNVRDSTDRLRLLILYLEQADNELRRSVAELYPPCECHVIELDYVRFHLAA